MMLVRNDHLLCLENFKPLLLGINERKQPSADFVQQKAFMFT